MYIVIVIVLLINSFHSFNSTAASLGGLSSSHWELPQEAVEFWKQKEKSKTLRNLLLHSADVSNPFKPWPICRAWAGLVLEEFFLQGDKEKEMGLTVFFQSCDVVFLHCNNAICLYP